MSKLRSITQDKLLMLFDELTRETSMGNENGLTALEKMQLASLNQNLFYFASSLPDTNPE